MNFIEKRKVIKKRIFLKDVVKLMEFIFHGTNVGRYNNEGTHIKLQNTLYSHTDEVINMAGILVRLLKQLGYDIDTSKPYPLVHDMYENNYRGESDITAIAVEKSSEALSAKENSEAENRKNIINQYEDNAHIMWLVGVADEYEKQATPYARLTKIADKLANYHRILFWNVKYPGIPLSHFFVSDTYLTKWKGSEFPGIDRLIDLTLEYKKALMLIHNVNLLNGKKPTITNISKKKKKEPDERRVTEVPKECLSQKKEIEKKYLIDIKSVDPALLDELKKRKDVKNINIVQSYIRSTETRVRVIAEKNGHIEAEISMKDVSSDKTNLNKTVTMPINPEIADTLLYLYNRPDSDHQKNILVKERTIIPLNKDINIELNEFKGVGLLEDQYMVEIKIQKKLNEYKNSDFTDEIRKLFGLAPEVEVKDVSTNPDYKDVNFTKLQPELEQKNVPTMEILQEWINEKIRQKLVKYTEEYNTLSRNKSDASLFEEFHRKHTLPIDLLGNQKGA